MRTADIDAGLARALAHPPGVAPVAAPISKCDLAAATIVFLETIRERAGWPVRLVLGWVVSSVREWARVNKCT